jgi:hypothetical protein
VISPADIDKLRDLVVRQEIAKHSTFDNVWTNVDPLTVERQLQTYLAEQTSAQEMKEYVEVIEARSDERVTQEREQRKKAEAMQRLWDVLDNALALAEGEELTYPYRDHLGILTQTNPAKFKRDVERLREEMTNDPDA